MSSPILQPFAELVATFNFRRAMSLIALMTILGAAAWSVDSYTDYSRISRLERILNLMERLDAMERRGAMGSELSQTKANMLAELSKISTQPGKVAPAQKGEFVDWFRRIWPKFVFGGLPWFAVSLFALPSVFKREKSAAAGFVALQFLTLFFGFVVSIIPATGSRVIDFIVIPWGILFAVGIVPISMSAVNGFRRSREASIQRAIMNNLRQIAAASDQYFLEHGVSEVFLDQIVGPDKLIRALAAVDGEQYEGLHIKQGEALVVCRKSGEEVRLET